MGEPTDDLSNFSDLDASKVHIPIASGDRCTSLALSQASSRRNCSLDACRNGGHSNTITNDMGGHAGAGIGAGLPAFGMGFGVAGSSRLARVGTRWHFDRLSASTAGLA